jgi:signal transduction histidine kinase
MSSTDSDRRIAHLTEAIEQATNTLRDRVDELSLVRRVGDAISQHTSIWSLSSEVVDAIATTINCRYAFIYAGSDASSFELQAVSSIFPGAERFPIRLSDTRILTHLEDNDHAIEISDLSNDLAWRGDWPFPKNLLSWLCVPLQTRNQLRGILCLADDGPGAFDERSLRILMMVVPQISSAFVNIGLYTHLRESETKYRTLVTRIQDAVYICNWTWQIVEANPAAEALFGGSIAGKSLTELFASPNAASEFVEGVRTSGVVQNFEAHLLTASNDNIVALLSCVNDGERYCGVIKDVTERTRLMEQVVRAQKMESIGTLAAGVAHDFNNILGIILPNAEFITMQADPDSLIASYGDTIVVASRRGAQLTKQLLSLSRTDPVAFRTVDVNEAVRSAGKLLRHTLNRNIRLDFDLTTETVNVKADENQLQQVLLNLAINARDAMPEGGVLKFTTRCEEATVIVRITDTGTGIDKETVPKIFDPFFTTKDKSKGTGLGLSVVYGILKQTGGTIGVKSELGLGTEFTLTFPSSNESRRTSVRRRVAAATGSEKILVADDEPDILKILVHSLRDLGYSVVSAQNGVEAVERAEADVKLIILDMIMPELDGVAALRRIREKAPHMKVIVTSGYTSPEKTPLLESLGIQAFVQKPFELVKLARTVRDVLDGVAR